MNAAIGRKSSAMSPIEAKPAMLLPSGVTLASRCGVGVDEWTDD